MDMENQKLYSTRMKKELCRKIVYMQIEYAFVTLANINSAKLK